jgi:surface carbohydrate biosynthesis protein
MANKFKKILLPVESQVRELDAKILFACAAAECGYEVIIGSRAHMHFYASRVKDCIYVAKSMRRFSDRMFKIMHELGHRIVAWDEEALVRLPDQEYYLHRLSPNTLKYIDHLFAWGENDAMTYREYSEYQQQNIHITGNPRIDILRKELRGYFNPEVDKIQEQYGNYVLINTNFGQVNHFIKSVGNKEIQRDSKYDQDHNQQFMSKRFLHKSNLFYHFKKMVESVAKAFPENNIIIRPHPSESLSFWKDHTKGITNIHINNTGNVIPWIMAARALVSNGCTTSIEAYILQKPTMGYYPEIDEEIDDALPKLVCDVSTTQQQLITKLSQVMSHTYQQDRNATQALKNHIANIEGDLSVDRICNVLLKSNNISQSTSISRITRYQAILHNELRTIVKKIKRFNASSRNSAYYHKHRFPGIDTEYLSERIGRYRVITNRFNHVKVDSISKNLYSIRV